MDKNNAVATAATTSNNTTTTTKCDDNNSCYSYSSDKINDNNHDNATHRIYQSLAALEADLGASDKPHATDVLEHSVPGVSGRVYTFSDEAIVAYENHSDTPNVSGMSYRWLDEGPGAGQLGCVSTIINL